MSEWTPPNLEFPPPKAGEPLLHRAARLGDIESIRRLVRNCEDINAVFDLNLYPGTEAQPATPLMVAAGSGDGATVETVQCLLDLGADSKAGTSAGTPVTFACLGLGWNYRPGGDAGRLKVLLEAGSPLPSDEKVLIDLLCHAAGKGDPEDAADPTDAGDPERLQLLLDQGLNPDGYWNVDRALKRRHNVEAFLNRISEDKEELAAQFPD